jgi:hypothetical protein
MKKCLLPCIFILAFFQIRAQLGFTAASTVSSTPDWQVVVENYIARRHTDFMKYGTTAMLDYNFKLKNEALGLQPALHYVRTSWGFYPYYFEVYAVGFQCNMNFALLPATNSKGNPASFRPILQLSPGLDLVRKKYDAPAGDGGPSPGATVKHTDRSFAFNAGANLLLEFRLSDLMTVSPLVGVRLYPSVIWDDFTEMVSKDSMAGTFDRTHWRQVLFGLRIGLDLKKD